MGIYRVNGVDSEIRRLKSAFDESKRNEMRVVSYCHHSVRVSECQRVTSPEACIMSL